MELYAVYLNGVVALGPFLSHFAAETAWLKAVTATAWRSYMYENAQVSRLSWQDRERMRFDEGIYTRPVWRHEDFTRSLIYEYHYVHISMDDPTMLAFTPDGVYGEADRQVKMKPGRYLQKFFPALGPKSIERLAHWFVTGQKPSLLNTKVGLKFTTNSDEVEWVYCNGPTSCMDGRKSFTTHPARVYATEDVAVAYMLSASDKEVVLARTVVNTQDKTYDRVYPTPDNWNEDGLLSYSDSVSVRNDFESALKEAGYRRRSAFLDGCKIKKISYKGDGCLFCMPYIDGDYTATSEADWDYFLLECGAGDNNTTNTRGWVECDDEYGTLNSNTARCECCDEITTDDELMSVVTSIGRNGDYITGTEMWCMSCVEAHTYYCSGLQRTVSDNISNICAADGEYYNLAYAEDNMFVSEFDDEWYDNDQLELVLTDDGVQRWSTRQAMRNAFECPILELDTTTDATWCHNEYRSERYTTFGGAPAKLNGDLDHMSEDEFNAMKERLELTDGDIVYIPPRCELTEELPLEHAA